MAKRFSDSGKWKKPFIRGLQAPYKLLWLYLLDECDHAGIWDVDFAVAQLKIGEKVSREKAISFFKEKIIEVDNGNKWFIPDFVDFQYGELNETNRVHESVIKILKKFNLLNSENKVLTSPLQGAKDKDKDKDMDKDKDKDKEKDPSAKAEIFSVHTTCKNFYVQFQQQNNRECNWNGKYAGSLSHILGKLKLTYAKSNGREPTENDITGSFEYLIKKLPEWYKDKELSIINSNYDSIVNEIKNGIPTTATGKKAGYTDSELIDGLEEYRRRNQVVNSK